MPTKLRELAMNWWNNMDLSDQYLKTIKLTTRHPKTLTGSEIEKIYYEHCKSIGICYKCNDTLTYFDCETYCHTCKQPH